MTFKMKLWPDTAPINHLTSKMNPKLNMTQKHDSKKERGLQNKRLLKTKDES